MSELKLVDIDGKGKKPSKPPLHFADLTPDERKAKIVELQMHKAKNDMSGVEDDFLAKLNEKLKQQGE